MFLTRQGLGQMRQQITAFATAPKPLAPRLGQLQPQVFVFLLQRLDHRH